MAEPFLEESFGIFFNLLESFGINWNHLEIKNPLKYFGILKNIFKVPARCLKDCLTAYEQFFLVSFDPGFGGAIALQIFTANLQSLVVLHFQL